MNLLNFSMIILLFPLASVANPTVETSRKTAALPQSPNRVLRRPAGATNLIDIKPKVNPASIILAPKLLLKKAPQPKGPTYFQLAKVPGKNELSVSFISKDPHLKLNPNSVLAIQFFTSYPFQLSRSLIMSSIWPKDGKPLILSYSNANPKIQNQIKGKAAYTYCHDVTHKCKSILDNILYYLDP